MKFSKSLVLLAAFLVAFGLAGSVDRAEAAPQIASVTVTAPADSGALRGIDSSFVVQTKVLAIAPPSNLSVTMFLVTADSKTILGDNVNNSGVNLNTIAAAISPGATALSNFTRAETGAAFSSLSSGVVAASQQRGDGTINGPDSDQATNRAGDADSVVVTTSGDTTTFTWYGRIDASTGTVGAVRAAAFGTNPSDSSPNSVVTVSASNQRFDVDGDRPNDSGTSFNNAVSSSFDNNDADSNNKLSDSGDQRNVRKAGNVTAPTPAVSGFPTAAGGSRVVLGIGDSLRFEYKLGSRATEVVFGDSLNGVVSFLGKTLPFDKAKRNGDIFQLDAPIVEGDFGDVAELKTATHTISYFLVDKAGNRSANNNPDATAPTGVTATASFLVDAKKPVLDGQVAAGDTLLPVSNDTLSDGTFNLSDPADFPLPNDINTMQYKLAESLDSLVVAFDGEVDLSITLDQDVTAAGSIKNEALGTVGITNPGNARVIDFTQLGAAAGPDTILVGEADGTNQVTFLKASSDSTLALKTGLHTIKVTGTDVAGNVGPTLTRTNVYVDVDDITLGRLFPTAASGLDTLDEETAKVIFKLSEPADSVLIAYLGISGPDNGKRRTRRLSGTELTNTSIEQTFPVDSLASGTQYVLSILARDLAGNFTQTATDTFLFDTTFVVPVIAKFKVEVKRATAAASSDPLLGAGSPVKAGEELKVFLNALTVDNRDAVTFKKTAIFKVGGLQSGNGVALVTADNKSVGATDEGSGRILLNADDWVTGSRTVVVKDTTSVDSLSFSIVDSNDVNNIFTGAFDSTVVVNPEVYSKILVSTPDTVDQGERFWVNVTLADKFGNRRVLDDRFVQATANQLGVELVSEQNILNGEGGFYARATGFADGDLQVTVRDALPTSDATAVVGADADTGAEFISGSSTLHVRGAASASLDAPDQLAAEDYTGADGEGDQGGFVVLTFDLSDDHDSLSGYRIFREVKVNYRPGDEGEDALVKLSDEDSKLDFVPWAKVDPVPGVDLMRVIVATLDNVETRWAVAAERGSATTQAKQAFVKAEAIASPYELMAQTLTKSKEAARLGLKTPVFAELTPEALAFNERGIVPQLNLNSVGSVFQSPKTTTREAVRAVDNIAPEPVPFLRVIDTQNDAGGSITLTWTKSVSDQLVPRGFAGAVGPALGDMVPGLKGYNIYRKVGEGEFALVGKANAGETQFVDNTVFNSVRYTYAVRPFDDDNITAVDSELKGSAMAIRNRVVDKNGQVVLGLFGSDNKVDFDDFFIFADHFGLSVENEEFDPAFDLNPTGPSQNKIDFDDFFVFADQFGRVIAGAGKVVPALAGLNRDASLSLQANFGLPKTGEEMVIGVKLADFVELRGYGFTVAYDPSVLEFVKVVGENGMLGGDELAQPRVLGQKDGEVSIAAFGETATEGDLGVSLVFRTLDEIESSFIEIRDAKLRDGQYGLNPVARLDAVEIQTRPDVFALGNNYPNPFNPSTTIKYALPEGGDVKLEIYNVIGQVVNTLVKEHQNAGRYAIQFDATNSNGRSLSSGIYFYRLAVGKQFQQVKKMLLLK